MRRIFLVFEGIDVLTIQQGDDSKIIVTNLKGIHRNSLEVLSPEVEKYYL